MRKLGAFFGTLIGDALGAPFEFLEYTQSKIIVGKKYLFPETAQQYEETFKTNKIVDCCENTHGNFNLNFGGLAGMWTDDSCQMMCLAEVLAFYKKVNGSQLHWAINDWWTNGFCMPYNENLQKLRLELCGGEVGSFGLGQTSKNSMYWFNEQKIGRKVEKEKMYTQTGNDQTDGNGALMRNGVTFLISSLDDAIEAAMQQAKTTHQGIASMLCCMLHTYVGWSFVNQKNLKDDFVDFEPFSKYLKKINVPEVFKNVLNSTSIYNWRAADWDLNQQTSKGCVGGYAVDCICLALHYLLHNKALEDLATRGGDSDTNAAVLGCLIGARHGIDKFDQNWIRAVLRFDEFSLVCARFLSFQ